MRRREARCWVEVKVVVGLVMVRALKCVRIVLRCEGLERRVERLLPPGWEKVGRDASVWMRWKRSMTEEVGVFDGGWEAVRRDASLGS